MRPGTIAVGWLALSAAWAGTVSASSIPCVPCSTVPRAIALVGSAAGVADAGGTFTLVMRDFVLNPLRAATVVLDLSACPDLRLCSDPLDAAATVDCAAHTIKKFTDATGQVTFIVLGGSNGAGHASSLAGSARLFVNGVQVARPTVAAFDLDGAGGVGIDDLAVWLSDFGSLQPWQRDDFDGDGHVGIADLSVWLGDFGSGKSAESCATSCP